MKKILASVLSVATQLSVMAVTAVVARANEPSLAPGDPVTTYVPSTDADGSSFTDANGVITIASAVTNDDGTPKTEPTEAAAAGGEDGGEPAAGGEGGGAAGAAEETTAATTNKAEAANPFYATGGLVQSVLGGVSTFVVAIFDWIANIFSTIFNIGG